VVDRIKTLLARRGAEFTDLKNQDPATRQSRLKLARVIAKRYSAFDKMRPVFGAGKEQSVFFGDDAASGDLRDALLNADCIRWDGNRYLFFPDLEKVRYLAGGWLEEYVFEAVLAAGADAAVVSQKLHWKVQSYHGLSEVDVIARKGDRLLFVSCKSGKAELAPKESKSGQLHRKRLMDYLHEADNLVDHFGMPGDVAVLVATTDLIDEENGNRARHSALFGRALRLDVQLITLESLRWGPVVERFKGMINAMQK